MRCRGKTPTRNLCISSNFALNNNCNMVPPASGWPLRHPWVDWSTGCAYATRRHG